MSNPDKKPCWFAQLPFSVVDSGTWARLSPKAKALYIVLLRISDIKTGNVSRERKDLAEKAGIPERDICIIRKELKDAGLINFWQKGFLWFYNVDKSPTFTATYQGDKSPRNTATVKQGKNGRFTATGHTRNTATIQPCFTATYNNRNIETIETQQHKETAVGSDVIPKDEAVALQVYINSRFNRPMRQDEIVMLNDDIESYGGDIVRKAVDDALVKEKSVTSYKRIRFEYQNITTQEEQKVLDEYDAQCRQGLSTTRHKIYVSKYSKLAPKLREIYLRHSHDRKMGEHQLETALAGGG